MQSHVQGEPDLLDLIDKQVRTRTDSICVECNGRQVTYSELKSKTDSIALRLKALGAKPGVLIAICLHRSVDFVAAVLGVLRSGAAYLPIDPAIPEKRLEFLLADSGAAFAITTESLKARLGDRTSYLVDDLLGAASTAS